jgi:hypothetical protein
MGAKRRAVNAAARENQRLRDADALNQQSFPGFLADAPIFA